MGIDKAKEIINNLNITIKKLENDKREYTTVVSGSTAFPSTRARTYELKRMKSDLIKKYNL